MTRIPPAAGDPEVERLTLERDAARTAIVTLAWLLSGRTPPPWPLAEICPVPDWWDEAAT